METAVVMSLECKHMIELSQHAAKQRDKSLLEKVPKQFLQNIQQRMISMMRNELQIDTQSQFYEAIPGQGVFGWQIVDQVSDATQSYADSVVQQFGNDLPGSIAKA